MRHSSILVLATAPEARVRALLPWLRTQAARLILVVPRGRRTAYGDLEADDLTLVPFDAAIAPSPSWAECSARLRTVADGATTAYVVVNDSALASYRDVGAALRVHGVHPQRIQFVVPADAATPVIVSLADWRAAARRARWQPWQARIGAVARRSWVRELAATCVLAAAAVVTWTSLVRAPWVASIALWLASHVLTWRYAAATAGEYSGDAAIHFQFARRFARGEWFCYNPGVFSAGSSSPLWTAVLGVLARVAGDGRLDRLALGLAWASLHAALLVIAAAAIVAGGANSLWGVAPAALAGSSIVFVWTGRAMEAPFALLATAAVALAVVAGNTPGAVAAVALACLVRWEHAFVLAPVVVWACVESESPWPLAAFVPAGLLVADVARRTGSLLPASGQARRRYAALRAGGREEWRIWTTRPDVWALAGIGVASGSTRGALVMTAWTAAVVLFFKGVVPGTYGGRYLVPALAAPALLAAGGATSLLRLPVDSVWWPAAIALLAWTGTRWVATAWRERAPVADEARRAAPLERGFRQTVARGLAALLPRDARLGLVEVDLLWLVARDDIRVVSLDGVLDGSLLEALDRGELVPALRQRRASHVLIETCLYARSGWTGLDLAALATADGPQPLPGGGTATPMTTWRYRNWGDRSSEWPWQLWRLEWPCEAGS